MPDPQADLQMGIPTWPIFDFTLPTPQADVQHSCQEIVGFAAFRDCSQGMIPVSRNGFLMLFATPEEAQEARGPLGTWGVQTKADVQRLCARHGLEMPLEYPILEDEDHVQADGLVP